MTTARQVIDTHRKHPDWSAVEIARHLGALREYVDKAARRNGLHLPPAKGGPISRERERCAKIAEQWNAPRIAAAIRALQ